MTTLSVFIATSLDGFIADADGGLDWLLAADRADEDYGYEAFIAGIDGVAMGRGTYDYIAHLEPLPYGDRPLFVFTHDSLPARGGVTFWECGAAEALTSWQGAGLQHVYVDGGRLISQFLTAGLIDDFTITVVPILLGSGKPLFHAGFPMRQLQLVDVQRWPSGMAQLRYVRG